MMSGTLQKAASNVLMDLLFSLTKRLEDQGTIASPVQKVTMKIYFSEQGFDFYCAKHFP